jgi:hypothetical protein
MGQSGKITGAKAAGLWLALSIGDALVSRVAERTGLLDLVSGLWGGEVLLSAGLILYCLAMGTIGAFAVYYSLSLLQWLWGRFQRLRQRDRLEGAALASRCDAARWPITRGPVDGQALAFCQRLEMDGFTVPSALSALEPYFGLLGPHAREFGLNAAKQASASIANTADAMVKDRSYFY